MKKTKLYLAGFAFLTLNFIMLSLTSQAQYSNLHLLDFGGTANGSTPYGDLISDGTYLYGMTSGGGAGGYGVIFKIKPDGTGYDTLHSFLTTGIIGNSPHGSLYYDGTYLYGMVSSGGINSDGTIFKIKPDGSALDTLMSFNGKNGNYPYGSLISDGTYLYGMVYSGGANGYGNVFKIKPNGTGFDTLMSFNGKNNGSYPEGSLYYDGTYLYGMTSSGGTNGHGTIFKIKSDGTGSTVLLQFNGPNGCYPYGSLISDGTFLYGMTSGGGINSDGNIFKIKPDGTGYADILDFNGANGEDPYGSLYYDGSTYLYGMTSYGGTNYDGNIFKVKTNGTDFTDLLDFNSTNGAEPYGSLYYDGTFFYGMTQYGGVNSDGTIFKFYPGCSAVTLTSASGTNYQTVCINTPITPITYQFTGAITSITNLPNGVTSSISGNVVTISGTPNNGASDSIGTFNYVVTTAGTASCSPDSSFGAGTIMVKQLPSATITGSTVLCQNVISPNITLTGSGNGPPYTFTYNINGGANQTVITNIQGDGLASYEYVPAPTDVAGTFTYSLVSVTYSGSTGCATAETGSAFVTIRPLAVNILSTNQTSVKPCNGYLEVVAKGVPPYTYTWSDSATVNSPYRFGVCSGKYKVIVSDSFNQCTDSAFAYITNNTVPSKTGTLSLSISSNDASKNTVCDGRATVTVSGGKPPYNIFYGADTIHGSTYRIDQLCSGFYTINVTDADTNSSSFTFVVGSPSTIYPTFNPAYADSTKDTLVTNAVPNCALNYGTIDSIKVTHYNFIGKIFDSLNVIWTIYQGGITTNIQQQVNYGNIPGPGVYVVVLNLYCTDRASGSIKATQAIYFNQKSLTGIETYNAPNIIIYPNPTSGIINLNTGQLDDAQISVYNVFGEIIYQHTIISSISQIDLSAQANGIYFIKLITEQGIVTKKIVISH